jgi:hypothetical protein
VYQADRIDWTYDCCAAERSLAGSTAATTGKPLRTTQAQESIDALFLCKNPALPLLVSPFKRLFGTLVRKLLLLIGLTLSSNSTSAPQALILVLRD